MADKSVTAESMERFRRNAGKAQVADLLGKITGASTDLVSYDAVATRLRARQQIEMGTQMIPLCLPPFTFAWRIPSPSRKRE